MIKSRPVVKVPMNQKDLNIVTKTELLYLLFNSIVIGTDGHFFDFIFYLFFKFCLLLIPAGNCISIPKGIHTSKKMNVSNLNSTI